MKDKGQDFGELSRYAYQIEFELGFQTAPIPDVAGTILCDLGAVRTLIDGLRQLLNAHRMRKDRPSVAYWHCYGRSHCRCARSRPASVAYVLNPLRTPLTQRCWAAP